MLLHRQGGVETKLGELKRMLRYGHHEAIAVTTGDDGTPHAAAMGVRVIEESLAILPYVGTRTFKNIIAGSAVSIAFTHDSLVFCDVVLRPSRLRYKRGRRDGIYLLDGEVDVYVEAAPRSINIEGERATVLLDVLDLYEGKRTYFPYSRANSMLVEALVYFTKIRSLSPRVCYASSECATWIEALRYSISIVKRLGSEELVECAKSVCEELVELGIRCEPP